MARTPLALAALLFATAPAVAAPTLAQPAADGPPGDTVMHTEPPPLRVIHAHVQVDAGPAWQAHDIRTLCGIEAPNARVRIEEVAGHDARAAADVALDGPTTLRLRASAGGHLLQVEISATDARGNQAFDRCRVQVR